MPSTQTLCVCAFPAKNSVPRSPYQKVRLGFRYLFFIQKFTNRIRSGFVSALMVKDCGQTVGLEWFGMWETTSSYPLRLSDGVQVWVQNLDLSQTTHSFYSALSTQKYTFFKRRFGGYTHYAQGLLKKLLFIYR